MAKSLQDQLLEAGAVKKDRAAKLKKAKHKQARQKQRGSAGEDEIKKRAREALAEKTERDRALSRQQNAERERLAIAAQVRQLIMTNRIELPQIKPGADNSANASAELLAYNFTDNNVVRALDVTGDQHRALVDGRLAIARLDGGFALIPAAVAISFGCPCGLSLVFPSRLRRDFP